MKKLKHIPKAKIIETDRVFSIVYFDLNWLENQKIKQCIRKARSNEFQFNFNTLQIRLTSNDKRFKVFIVIPLGIFNYEQFVSAGYIKFNLKNLDQESLKIKNDCINKIKDLESQLIFFNRLNNYFDVSFLYTNDTFSMHRHPGRFSFSSIDLDNDPNNPGVVYRKKEAKNVVQVDAVFILDPDIKFFDIQSHYLCIKDFRGGVKGCYSKNDIFVLTKNKIENFEKYLFSSSKDHFSYLGNKKILKTEIGKLIIKILKNLNYEKLTGKEKLIYEEGFKKGYAFGYNEGASDKVVEKLFGELNEMENQKKRILGKNKSKNKQGNKIVQLKSDQ